MSETTDDHLESPLAQFSSSVGLHVADRTKKQLLLLHPDITVTEQELGLKVSQMDLFRQNGEIVYFDHEGERKIMTPLAFRSWVNERLIVYEKRDKNTDCAIPMTMSKETAATILVSEPFLRGVRVLRGMNSVRLPVIRESGALELLPYGYDQETGIFTVDTGIQYDTEMALEAANGWVRRIYGWAPITDERGWGVLCAGMLALYVRHLPGGTGLRPGFVVRGNKPGCGKSVIVKSWQYPVLGRAPAVKMKQGEQLDKEMEAFMIAAVPVIFLDNVYGSLRSATIDQMLTSEESEGRAMGGHGLFRAKNSALLMISANNIEGNEDAERRFLLLDLFEPNDISERQPPEEDLMDDNALKSVAWRSRMLSVCWAMVKHWHEQGMKKGSVKLQSFERYSGLLGGIVEGAGWTNPFTKPAVEVSLNPEQAEFMDLMEGVLEEMGEETEKDFTIEDLARIARARQLYEKDVGTREQGRKLTIKEDKLDKNEAGLAEDRGYLTDSHRSAFGKKLKKRNGDQPKVRGKKLEFGKRYSRKSTYEVKVVE